MEASHEPSANSRSPNNRDLPSRPTASSSATSGPQPRRQPHATLGLSSRKNFVDQAVPASIRMVGHLNLEPPRSETAAATNCAVSRPEQIMQLHRHGLPGTVTPPVIQRNILETPAGTPTPPPARNLLGRLKH
ncbi:MAG: hypothetical protein H6667_24655 [Ardenticatenaceae bacterium]|nr:hypothetical protein [Ardenticatenaceae bacterium]